MIVDRVFTPGLAQVAYVVADEDAREVAILDPRRDVGEYVAWAEARDFRIVAIVETHVHADFVSGGLELAAVTGAPIFASRRGDQEFPHQPLDDGDAVPVGNLRLRALFTPGHTPEHMSYLLIDPARGDGPVALFSGDLLFVGEVGRPDLLGEEHTRRLAEELYATLHERLASLGDGVVVYPGHTAGSACGRKIGDAPYTTMGQERLFNYALQPQSREAFIDAVLGGMPKPPTYYPVLKRINKVGAAPLSSLRAPSPLTADDVAARQDAGALVIDTRDQEAFGTGFIPGARFAGLGPSFAAWMGWIAPYDRDLLLVLDDDAKLDEALTELRRIGLDCPGGFLAGGMAAWRASGREVTGLPFMSVDQLAARQAQADDGLAVLDVRTGEEWNDGHIAGARHRFAGEIVQGAGPPVSKGEPVALICGTAYRSTVAASELHARGYRNLVNVMGGMTAWEHANLPVVRERSPQSV
jgi:hydroxyacylglutathione hydrolase